MLKKTQKSEKNRTETLAAGQLRETEEIWEIPIKNSNITGMTEGNIIGLILRFAVPVIISNIFQQMYTVSDAAIVSYGVGLKGMAALGVTEWMNWIMVGGVSSLGQGFAIVVSQMYGSRDLNRLRKAVAMIVLCSFAAAALLTLMLEGILSHALIWLNVSSEIYPLAYDYSSIFFWGTSAAVFYNSETAILRALGDSKTPLKAIVLSSVLNIVLDLLFVFGFGWGVKGAAAATVIVQLVAAVYCLIVLKKLTFLKPHRGEWRPDFRMIGLLMKMSIPIVLETIIICISGMIVQSVVNIYGTVFVVGISATNKLYNTLTVISTSLGFALATFLGQNYGAGRIDRIRKSVWRIGWIAFASSIILLAILFLFARPIVTIMISPESADGQEAIENAAFYLRIFAVFLWSLYLSTIFRYALQGIGRTWIIMISGCMGFLLRVLVALFLPQYFGMDILYYDEIMGWIAEALPVSIGYIVWAKRFKAE